MPTIRWLCVLKRTCFSLSHCWFRNSPMFTWQFESHPSSAIDVLGDEDWLALGNMDYRGMLPINTDSAICVAFRMKLYSVLSVMIFWKREYDFIAIFSSLMPLWVGQFRCHLFSTCRYILEFSFNDARKWLLPTCEAQVLNSPSDAIWIKCCDQGSVLQVESCGSSLCCVLYRARGPFLSP